MVCQTKITPPKSNMEPEISSREEAIPFGFTSSF